MGQNITADFKSSSDDEVMLTAAIQSLDFTQFDQAVEMCAANGYFERAELTKDDFTSPTDFIEHLDKFDENDKKQLIQALKANKNVFSGN